MTDQLTDTGLVAGTWSLDPAHTTIGFTARHLMSKVRGTFNDFDGRITTTTKPAGVDHRGDHQGILHLDQQRAAGRPPALGRLLRSEIGGDLTFRSTAIRPDGDGYVITGDLTINGVTRSVDLAGGVPRLGREPFRHDRARRRGDHHHQPARLQRQLEHADGRRPVPGRPEGRHQPVDRGRPRRVAPASGRESPERTHLDSGACPRL